MLFDTTGLLYEIDDIYLITTNERERMTEITVVWKLKKKEMKIMVQ